MISYTVNQNNVRVIKGEYYNIKQKYVRKKVIVFDLDETIGHFFHLQIIHKCFNRELTQEEFNQLLDLFPEFFRPGIITIFELLLNKKKKNNLYKLYIYTNNQNNGEWVQMIVNYIQTKLKSHSLFDKIINAFKINNKIVELKRTSHIKQYSDFIQCTMLPEEIIETCFIDNTYYDKMCEDKIYYILPKSYYHSLKKQVMIQRIMGSSFPEKEMLKKCLDSSLPENNHTSGLDEIAITKKIMYHVREFLYYPKIPRTNKTKRATMRKDGTRKKNIKSYKNNWTNIYNNE